MDAEIRTLVFNQGVGVATPPGAVDNSNKTTIANNTNTGIDAIAFSLTFARAVIINYYLYRRTDSGFKSMSGQIMLEGQNDAVASIDKWKLSELARIERGGDSGISFSTSVVSGDTSKLNVTADNMAGANYSCTMYWKISTLLT